LELEMRLISRAVELGQTVEHRRRWRDADARMQEKQRPPAPSLDGLDAGAVDHQRAGHVVCGH
jgi:hypothetical protein